MKMLKMPFCSGGFKSPPQLVGLKRDSMRGRGMANEKWKAFTTYID